MTTSLAEQLKKSGVTGKRISQFDVFTIFDELIDFPEERLDQQRKKHAKRFVIILQNNKDNENPVIQVVLVAPLSTKPQQHRLDYLLAKKDSSFLPSDSYIRLRYTQPILKMDLKAKWGNVAQSDVRDRIKDRLFDLFGF